MTKNLDKEGLRAIADNYDLFYIDLWGVIHNGIKLHKNAILTVKEILNLKKDIVLLTNAPRPNKTVREFLEKLKRPLLKCKLFLTFYSAYQDFLRIFLQLNLV